MADVEQKEKPETPLEKSLRRNGKCFVAGCNECEFFAYDKHQDGFRLCMCGHTQHSHEFGEADVN